MEARQEAWYAGADDIPEHPSRSPGIYNVKIVLKEKEQRDRAM